jgi:hypothetical protein
MLSPDVENVLSIQKKRSVREEQLKNKILNSVKDKINNYANFGQTNFIYTIPNFLIGEMPYTLESMNKYIVKKLKSEGFYIVNISTQYIYISWNIKDISKVAEQKKNKLEEKYNNNINFSAFTNSKKTF